MERTGWSLTNHVAECVLEQWLVSDHPVCGRLSVASQLFIEAAATPPHEEGNAPTPDSLVIHSHVLSPGLIYRAAARLRFVQGGDHEEITTANAALSFSIHSHIRTNQQCDIRRDCCRRD